MRSLIVKKPNQLELDYDAPMPIMMEYDALVKNECCIICNGTDNEILTGKLAEAQKYPLMLGHESAGYIVQRGSKVRNYSVGDLVTRSIVRENQKYYSNWGAFSDYGIVTDYNAMIEDGFSDAQKYTIGLMQCVFPQGITAEEAAITITLKEVYSAFERMGITRGDRLLICGDGPVAICMLAVSQFFGVTEFNVLGQNPMTLDVLRRNGASRTLSMFQEKDMIELVNLEKQMHHYIDTIGKEETIHQGMRFLQTDGQITVYGLHTEKRIFIPLDGMRNWALRFMQFPIHSKEGRTHQIICDAVLNGFLKPKDIISHRFSIEEYRKGFEVIRDKKAIKVALFFDTK